MPKTAQSFRLNGETVLITGGTGFVGRWLLADLAQRWQTGERFSAVVPSRNPEHFLASYPTANHWPWLKLIKGDIVQPQTLPGFDLFIHGATDTAANAHCAPEQIFWTILDGTRNVLARARQNRARGVLLSTGSIYGAFPADILEAEESARFASDCTVVGQGQSYGEAKRAMECLGSIAAHDGVAVCSARLFAFVGPGLPLDGHFAIGNFIRDALAGRDIVLLGDGRPVRSYLYAGELPRWLWTLLEHGTPGEAYNVGSDEERDLASWANAVKTNINPDVNVQIRGKDDGSPRNRYVPSLKKVRRLGLDIDISPEEAIRRTAGFHRSNKEFFVWHASDA